ncbi:hypothetical protein G6F16_005669 [Rhizopus arrhizus]|nr:hypothetical protein G6F16_005669 [Rhizopus arrhizus]KAG0909220.1 hypothetical protein G6F33_008992 [Rhizopus arrhizus]
METNALDDAKTKVNIDHNKLLNGNKVDLRKRDLIFDPLVRDNDVSVADDAKTKVNIDHNKVADGNTFGLRKRNIFDAPVLDDTSELSRVPEELRSLIRFQVN